MSNIIVHLLRRIKQEVREIKASIYARYSSENQSEESITAQVRACTKYCEDHGMRIEEIYIDRAQSARSDKRPEFQRMIKEAKQGRFGAVVVHKLDRFSRDRYDHANYKRKLKESGVRLLSVLENLDESPESVIMESLLEGMAEYYSRNLGRETRKGLREVALKAKYTGGAVLYGYEVDSEGNYVVNEKEAAVVRRIFRAAYERTGYNKLLEELHAEGVQTKRGNDFNKNTLFYMLKNPRYTGDYVYSTEGERKKAKSDPIVIPDAIPAIIDREQWNEVQRIMKRRSAVGKAAGKPYLLSGILYCGKCGAPMYGHRQKKNGIEVYRNYECSNRKLKHSCDAKGVNGYRIEESVEAYIKQLLAPANVEAIKQYMLQHLDQIGAEAQKEKAEIEKALKKIESKKEKALDLLLEGDLPKEVVKKKLNELEDQQAILESKLSQITSIETPEKEIEKGIIECKNFSSLTEEEKREIITKIIKKITVAPNDGDQKTVYIALVPIYTKLGGEFPTPLYV